MKRGANTNNRHQKQRFYFDIDRYEFYLCMFVDDGYVSVLCFYGSVFVYDGWYGFVYVYVYDGMCLCMMVWVCVCV